jgi:hypothetical protein
MSGRRDGRVSTDLKIIARNVGSLLLMEAGLHFAEKRPVVVRVAVHNFSSLTW